MEMSHALVCFCWVIGETDSALRYFSAMFLGPTVGLLEPQNLRVSDEWYTRFRVAWDPAPAPVLGYKLVYQPTGTCQSFKVSIPIQGYMHSTFLLDIEYVYKMNKKISICKRRVYILFSIWVFPDKDETLEVFVGDVTSYTLHNLLPGTTYDVKVFAQYDAGVSGALTGQGTTRRCLVSCKSCHCSNTRSLTGIYQRSVFTVH